MADWIWITILGLLQICFLVINLRLLFYFEHPDDSKYNQGLLAKLMIILGLQLAWLVVCLLPVDGHTARSGSSTNIQTFWEIIFLFLIVFLALPFPIAIFYYEADSDPRVTKIPPWKKTLFYSLAVFALVAVFVGVGYAIMKPATIPVDKINCGSKYLSKQLKAACGGKEKEVTVTTPYLIYQIAISAFVGWWGFVVFAGVGLAALPVTLIMSFVDRPSAIDFATYSEKRRKLGEKAFFLRASGEGLKKGKIQASTMTGIAGYRHRMNLQRDSRKFKQSVHLLEEEYQNLMIAYNERGENPVVSYCKLFAGIFCGLLSLIWICQIILAILVPQLTGITLWNFDDFLVLVNKLEVFALDLATYGFMVIYLLLAVVVGCFKYGLRVFVCFPINPMKKGDTHLNRFLLNVAVVLLASGAVTHFSVTALPKYSRNSAADLIFFHYVQYERVLSIFFKYHIFTWALLVWSLFCFVIYIFRPREKPAVSRLNFKEIPGAVMQHGAEGTAERPLTDEELITLANGGGKPKKKSNRFW